MNARPMAIRFQAAKNKKINLLIVNNVHIGSVRMKNVDALTFKGK